MCRVISTLVCGSAALLLALVALAGLGCLDRFAIPKKPDLPDNENWGPDKVNANEAVEATNVSVSDEALEDLKTRLRAFKLVEPLEGATFEYGFNGRFMQKLVAHWLERYDWRVWEERINSFHNYYTRIEGLRVHFMHVKPPKETKKRLPLLLLHGWPGSVFEFHKLLPLLTTPDADGLAFEVVAPSIPGYAWSEAPRKRGFNELACARVFNKLMLRLGFHKYYLHGGDWGSIIGHVMDVEYPDRLLGFHTNMPMMSFSHPSILVQSVLGAFLPVGVLFDQKDSDKLYPFFGKLGDIMREFAHMHLQATRPDTIGHALSDSPVGLAAYIVEKFSVWTDPQNRFAPDGNLVGPKAAFTLDELLTNVMIYWTTGSIASSMRLYKESFSHRAEHPSIPSEVPYGVASFAHELAHVPERLCRRTHPNLLRFAEFDTGGHFAALQLPGAVSSEIREFVRLAEVFHAGRRPAELGKKAEL